MGQTARSHTGKILVADWILMHNNNYCINYANRNNQWIIKEVICIHTLWHLRLTTCPHTHQRRAQEVSARRSRSCRASTQNCDGRHFQCPMSCRWSRGMPSYWMPEWRWIISDEDCILKIIINKITISGIAHNVNYK